MKKVFFSVLWGLATWCVLTFLVGGIWSMTQGAIYASTGALSSNVDYLIFLPPSLLLATVLVYKGKTQLIKKSLISILLAQILWFVLSILTVLALIMSGISYEMGRSFLYVFNSILLGIMIVCSGYFVFVIHPRLKKTNDRYLDTVASLIFLLFLLLFLGWWWKEDFVAYKEILKWLLNTAVVFIVLSIFIMNIVHGATLNNWIKLPIFIILSMPSAFFIIWINYNPSFYFFFWIITNYGHLKYMEEKKFILKSSIVINKQLFWISTNLYITLTCGLALFFGTELLYGYETILLLFSKFSMPNQFPLNLLMAWVLFYIFLITHVMHQHPYSRGSSECFYIISSLSILSASISYWGLLIYYYTQVTWYWPFVLFIGGRILGNLILRTFLNICNALQGIILKDDDKVLSIGLIVLIVLSFIGWPASALWVYSIISSLKI